MTTNYRSYKYLLIAVLFINFDCFAEPAAADLEGSWKIEGKDSFEHWEKTPKGDLTGESYKQEDGKKVVLETLFLRIGPDKTVYEATVPDQNDGQTVAFTLNHDIVDVLSFENPAHDFPSKLIYRFENTRRLFVEVKGNDGNGFSFYMNRID